MGNMDRHYKALLQSKNFSSFKHSLLREGLELGNSDNALQEWYNCQVLAIRETRFWVLVEHITLSAPIRKKLSKRDKRVGFNKGYNSVPEKADRLIKMALLWQDRRGKI